MGYKILTLSPGSTSTKVALFDDTKEIFRLNVTHPAEELAKFDQAGHPRCSCRAGRRS